MNLYYTPFYQELRKSGYVPELLSPKAKDAVDTVYSTTKSPIRKYYVSYMKFYKSNNSEITKRIIASYVYGLQYPQQFNNEPINAILSGIAQANRSILHQYFTFIDKEPSKYIILPYNNLIPMAEQLSILLYHDCKEQLQRINGEQVPYWFEKPKKPKLHKPVADGGIYRIEKYLGDYE